MQLTFSVQNQIITRTDDFKPVAKSQNYLRASFTFSDDWGDDDKIAIFHVGNDNYEMILDSENECLVPWEALVVARNMYVSVYSGDRITASEALVKILPTGYTERISATQDPSIDVYSSLLSRMNSIDEDIVNQVNTALAEVKESGEFKGDKGDKGDPGDDYVLTQADKEEIADLVDGAVIDDNAGTGDTDKTWSANKISSELENAGSVKDVKINGTSIVDSETGEAEIPIAGASMAGVVKIGNGTGIGLNSNDFLAISAARKTDVKAGTDTTKPIVSASLGTAAFYGLAKAAGDTTQSQSSNEVGTYTDDAKAAIKNMLGVIDPESKVVTVTGTDPVIQAEENTRYMCGEVLSLSFTPSASGICEVIFTAGSTLPVITLPQTVKMPEWFEIETDHTYDISIVDGVYGAVMVW